MAEQVNNQQSQGVEVNPNYVIEELINKNANLTMENAKLSALIRQLDEEKQGNQK